MKKFENLESALKKIEILETKIKRRNLQIIHFEAAKKAFEKRAVQAPRNKVDLEWLMKAKDYVNFHEKRAIRAKYWLKKYKDMLAELKSKIDRGGIV